MLKWIFLIFFFQLCFADQATQDAIKQTQDDMMDPQKRSGMINSSDAQRANSQVQKLTGGNKETEQEIWALAAELVPIMAAKGENDPKKMLQYLDEMKKNPEQFAAQFPPEQREKLKQIANKLKSKGLAKP